MPAAVVAAGSAETALLFLELGGIFLSLALLARLAAALGFSPIPLYLLAGLAFGTGGLLPLELSESSSPSAPRSASCCCCSCSVWSTPPRS